MPIVSDKAVQEIEEQIQEEKESEFLDTGQTWRASTGAGNFANEVKRFRQLLKKGTAIQVLTQLVYMIGSIYWIMKSLSKDMDGPIGKVINDATWELGKLKGKFEDELHKVEKKIRGEK